MRFAGSIHTSLCLLSILPWASGLATSCQQGVDCGDGTIERNGRCEPADNSKDPNAVCGIGTMFDPATQTCVSNFEPVECDPSTTVPVVDMTTGVTRCVGIGGTGDCSTPLVCATPQAGKISVCGQILDIETGQPVQTDGVRTDACQSPATGGPCALVTAFFDVTAFVTNPQTARPQAVESLTIDECGRFRAVNVDPPTGALPALGIGVFDHPASGTMDHALSGGAFPAMPGQIIQGVRAYAVKRTTDMAWTTSAGNPAALGGQTFAQKGVYVALFRYGALPVAGVQITAGMPPMVTDPANTFYFSSGNGMTTVRDVDPAAQMTSSNGAGLLVDSTLQPHSGVGSEMTGCSWPIDNAASLPGVVFVQERHLFVTGSPTRAPCP